MTQHKSYRMTQVNRLLQQEIANILLMEMQDERFRSVTVTEVRTTKDLRHATVLLTVYDGQHIDEIMHTVNQSAGMIRKLMGSNINLKRTPELEFRYDDSLDHAIRIQSVLKKVEEDLVDDEDSAEQ